MINAINLNREVIADSTWLLLELCDNLKTDKETKGNYYCEWMNV